MIIAAYVANYNVKGWSSRYSYQIILVLCRLHYAKQVAAQEHNSIVAKQFAIHVAYNPIHKKNMHNIFW